MFKHTYQIEKQTRSCLSWLQLIKSTVTRRLVESTEMFHADLILANFLQKGQLWQNI